MSEAAAIPLTALTPIRAAFLAGLPGISPPAHAPAPERDAAPPPSSEEVYAQGFAAGVAEARRDMGADLAAQLAARLDMRLNEPREELGLLIASCVQRLVTQIVGACPVPPDDIQRRAEAAARLIHEDDAPTGIALHPDDAALLPSSLGGVPILACADLARGDIVILCAAGTIEDRITARLAALDAALGLETGA